jgi:hypothetical protein
MCDLPGGARCTPLEFSYISAGKANSSHFVHQRDPLEKRDSAPAAGPRMDLRGAFRFFVDSAIYGVPFAKAFAYKPLLA